MERGTIIKMPFHENVACGLTYLCELVDNLELESRRWYHIPVPLSNVHLDVKVVNFTSEVTVTQTFINKERNPIECIYNFPVEEEAAVVDFTAELEGRTIKTVIKEKAAAREEYQQAVNNRHTAVLLEETKQDIFEIKVGHLSPGEACVVKMTYIMELPVEQKMTKLTIPTTIAPRYAVVVICSYIYARFYILDMFP